MTLKEKLVKLLNVKTVIAIILTIIFSYMAIIGYITAEVFMPIFSMIIAFYFSDDNKNKNDNNNNSQK